MNTAVDWGPDLNLVSKVDDLCKTAFAARLPVLWLALWGELTGCGFFIIIFVCFYLLTLLRWGASHLQALAARCNVSRVITTGKQNHRWNISAQQHPFGEVVAGWCAQSCNSPVVLLHTEILGLGMITKHRDWLLLLSSCALEGVIWLNSLIFLQLWLWFINWCCLEEEPVSAAGFSLLICQYLQSETNGSR